MQHDTLTLSLAMSYRSVQQLDDFTVIKMMLLGPRLPPVMFSHFCHFAWFDRGPLETSCDLPNISPSGQQPRAVPLTLFPVVGHVTAVTEHLSAMAVVQGEALALPLTSTSTE